MAEPATSGPGADPDGDGLANIVEYALNLNPRQPARDGLPVLRLQIDPSDGLDYAVFEYRRRLGSPGVTYQLSVATDLTGVNWTTAGEQLAPLATRDDGDGVTETVSVRFRLPVQQQPAAFLRLQVSLP